MTCESITDAAPEACTLPTVDRPLRVQEFDALFAAAISTARVDEVTLRSRLHPDAAAAAADLATRESACCSFFTFSLQIGDGDVEFAVAVPPAYAGVIAALSDRAREVRSCRV